MTLASGADNTLISRLIERQQDAWNAGDAHAFSDAFMHDGCFVNILGAITYGREPFEAQHARIFASIYKGSHIHLPVRRMHFLRPDVVLVDIDAELSNCAHLPPGLTTEADGIVRTRLQEVLIKETDRWMVASFHNVDIKPGMAPPRK
jgi:uncharacterized protein (TIGR02246 family)